MKTSDNYITNMSKEERKENGRKGGIASGKSRREKRKMKDLLEYLMTVPVKDKKKKVTNAENIKDLASVHEINVDTETAILLAQIQKALTGDTQAFVALRDTLGEKPKDVVEQMQEVVVITDDI